MELKWFAVYTRPRWEKKVAETLSKNEIENYCPLNKVERRWSDRKKIVEEPLFTSYVFVRTTLKLHTVIREMDGIVNFVYWLGRPAVIRDEEIEIIKEFLEANKNVRIEQVRMRVHDHVKIISGLLKDLQGKVVSVNNNTVRVSLPSLGCVMAAEIGNEHLTVI